MTDPAVLITICARGGSKGIPGKNIRMLAGQPLISYSIRAAFALAADIPADISISTDDAGIARTAAAYGLSSAYERPAALAGDTVGKKETILDLLLYEEKKNNRRYDFILDLDVTSPLRSLQDLKNGFTQLAGDQNAMNLFSVNPAARNPYFNMVERNAEGYCTLVKQGSFLTRQSAPAVYELNASFYWYRRSYFEDATLPVINNRSLAYAMDHICFDLDHEQDFEYMEYLLRENKIGFIP